MRRGREFASWLVARWPALVRTLVFLGHRQAEAEEIAVEGLARALPGWEREQRDGDVEVHVYRAVLDARARVLRRSGDRPVPDPEPVELPPGLTDRLERRRALETWLAELSPEDRTRLVLLHVAELSEDEVDDVAGGTGPLPPMPFPGPDVRDACEAVPVPPAPVAVVAARARRRRRDAWTRGLAAAAVLAVVAGAVTWWAARPAEDGQGDVRPASNPLPLPWYADGTLHLADVVVETPEVLQLADVPDGVVLSDADGHVVHVDGSGDQQRIGETVAGSRLAVDHDNGWVAWADPGDGDPQLVVHDTLAGEEVGRRSLAGSADGGGQPVGDSEPIALEGERVYYSSPDGDFAWEPLLDISFALAGSMVDTAEGARISRFDDQLRMTPIPLGSGVVVDAEDARLTPDGRYAFVVRDGQLAVYDVATAEPIDRMYSPSDEAVSWAYREGTFVFAVLHMLQDKTYQDMLQMPSEGNYRLYACRPELATPCRKLGEVPEEVPDPPVFAQ
ncbi:hypothetical protein [Nocardioides euryhalodurans]|uniref:Uncharacterized protein n=1 Tax=Nocardioides euryhalodurans TaxID=2518370 RepID=A0A4P7GIG6_9ACTN|nr:hypothetical protein [Nocardioides euryhalodurans]QBR91461.1 hypothetical protein EXE57_03650 [Nocardioides euryhalodurans]